MCESTIAHVARVICAPPDSDIAAAYAGQAEEYRQKASAVWRVLVGERADLVEEG
jgi:hypothetical protein